MELESSESNWKFFFFSDCPSQITNPNRPGKKKKIEDNTTRSSTKAGGRETDRCLPSFLSSVFVALRHLARARESARALISSSWQTSLYHHSNSNQNRLCSLLLARSPSPPHQRDLEQLIRHDPLSARSFPDVTVSYPSTFGFIKAVVLVYIYIFFFIFVSIFCLHPGK